MDQQPPEGSRPRSRPRRWPWALLIGFLVVVLFWQFVPKIEVDVPYYPWFIEQVESDNIKTLSIRGNELRGEVRREQPYLNPSTSTTTVVRKFSTGAPSEASINTIVQMLIQGDKRVGAQGEKTVESTRIEAEPPNSASATTWIILLLPTFVILGFIYLMMRRAREQSYAVVMRPDSRDDQSKAGDEGKVARAEQAVVEALKLCRETAEGVALSQERRERLELAMSELHSFFKTLPRSM
jgi:hypothetical protein